MVGKALYFLLRRLYSSFKDQRFDRVAQTQWNRIDKKRTEKKWNKRKKREKCGSVIYARHFGRDRPEENLPCFYLRFLGCPSLSPSFVCISSAAIHSRRLSRTIKHPRNYGQNAIIWDAVIS